MAFNMKVWENSDGLLVELAKHALDKEERLEKWIEKDTDLLGLDILIVGRQVRTPSGGRIDLLGLDAQGDVVIIELKRNRTPREVVAQILDYASWVDSLSAHDIQSVAKSYLQQDLSQKFFELFDVELPEVLNASHRMVIVASELDDSSERIVQYLSSRHSLDINVVFFSCFLRDGHELVGRSWLMDPDQVEQRSETRQKAEWTGYWFVNVGEGEHRNWEDCRKYGFLAAGHGRRYSEALKKLKIGDQFFAYMKGKGYVGFGEVDAEATPARDFVPKGGDTLLFNLPLVQDGIKKEAESPDLAEWVVGVKWNKTFSADEARYLKGQFANQNIVCKLRDQQTMEFLKKQFGLAE